uniref:Zgc:154054 n=1 Tax=Cyprinus carpio carpio TaxID=630221 RepID=A0A9J7XKS7_CYPCA
MRSLNGKLFFLACFLYVLMLTSWHTSKSDNLPFQLRSVYERLLQAEQRGEVLSKELLKVLGQLQNRSTATLNRTISNSSAILEEKVVWHLLPSQPNAYIYLPHLREHEDSLKPILHLGQRRTGVSLVLGVPTVHRQKQSYLVNTLQSLLFDLSTAERKDIVIVVFIAETNARFVNAVVQSVQTNLPDAVSSGVIEVISPSTHYYPDLSNLKETFGDPRERVRWRTKQNLDYSFLMLYAQSKGTYYVQLEDDIVAKQGFFESMKKYIADVLSEEWLFLEFSQLGFIGKLFRTSDLPMIVEFFLMFHKEKPIDWLLDHILWVKVCNPEKDSDKDFGNQVLFKGHDNPPAELRSSLEKYMSHTLERAYSGVDFFWGLTPKRGDYILITFTTPQAVKGYLFRSGNIETNGDRFYNTTVEVLPTSKSVKERVTRGELACCKPSTEGFVQIGSFKNGVAEGEVDGALGEIAAMRLLVHSDSDVWVLLSEIFIKV